MENLYRVYQKISLFSSTDFFFLMKGNRVLLSPKEITYFFPLRQRSTNLVLVLFSMIKVEYC